MRRGTARRKEYLRYADAVVRWGVLIAIGLVACGESTTASKSEPPAELELVAPEGIEICAGTKAWATAEAERVAAVTGLPLRHALRVELGAAAVEASCGHPPVEGQRIGCTTGTRGTTRVFAEPIAFSHELTHALRRQWGLSTVPIFEEGYAEAINGSDAYPSYVEREVDDEKVDVAALVMAGEPTVGAGQYRVATHFMRWLMAEYGESEVAGFMTSGSDPTPEDTAARFESAFGESLSSVGQRWSEQATGPAFRGGGCPDAISIDGATAAIEASIRCDAEDTFGLAGEVSLTRRCFRLGAEQAFDLALEGARGAVRLEVVPVGCDVELGASTRSPVTLEAGDVRTAALAGCTWIATFLDPGVDPLDLTLRFTAK